MTALIAAVLALNMPVGLTIYATGGYPAYGGGPATHPMPSMDACVSTGERIASDLKTKLDAKSRASFVVFSCQAIRP